MIDYKILEITYIRSNNFNSENLKVVVTDGKHKYSFDILCDDFEEYALQNAIDTKYVEDSIEDDVYDNLKDNIQFQQDVLNFIKENILEYA